MGVSVSMSVSVSVMVSVRVTHLVRVAFMGSGRVALLGPAAAEGGHICVNANANADGDGNVRDTSTGIDTSTSTSTSTRTSLLLGSPRNGREARGVRRVAKVKLVREEHCWGDECHYEYVVDHNARRGEHAKGGDGHERR